MPTEVAGTKVIAIDYPDKPDQPSVYAALGRKYFKPPLNVAFMGSDLSFEDSTFPIMTVPTPSFQK